MTPFRAMLAKLRRDERGATAIEYGLIAALMSVIVIASIGLIDDGLTDAFTNIGETLSGTAD